MRGIMVTKNYKTIGTVGRFKPVHLAHSAMLEALCDQSEHIIIGLGSSNVYDYRSPFTAKESKDMIDLALKDKFDNYTIIEIPDLFNGPKWREQALRIYGTLDLFATANEYVTSKTRASGGRRFRNGPHRDRDHRRSTNAGQPA